MNRLLFSLLFLVSFNSFGALDNQTKSWLGLFSKKKFETRDLSFWQEIQYRYSLDGGENQQILTRFGLLKNVNEAHEIGLIMGYIQTGNIKEYRPTLQHTYSTLFENHKFLLRSRLEWRDQEDNADNSIRYRLMNSYRYQLTPLYSLLVWDEPFLNLTKEEWTGDRWIERNRLFLGIRIDQKDHRFEVGYMNQFVPRNDKDVSEHILVAYFFF